MDFILVVILFLSLARVGAMFNREVDPKADASVRDAELIRFRITRGKRRAVEAITFGIELPGNLRFALRPEGEFDSLAKFLGLSREFQTQDRRFDNCVYIDCENAALNDALAVNPKLRQAIYALLPTGAGRRLRACNGWLWMSTPLHGIDRDTPEETIALDTFRESQPTLVELRDELKSIRGPEIDREPTRRARDLFMTSIVTIVALGAVGLVFYFLDQRLQMVNDSILYVAGLLTLGVTGTMLLGIFIWLRGISRTHSLVADVLFAALPAAWVAAFGGLMHFNQAFDPGEARRLTIPLEKIYEVKGSEGSSYYLVARRWPDERVEPKFGLKADEYELAKDRKCIDVLWRRGRLGDPWIEKFLASERPVCEYKLE